MMSPAERNILYKEMRETSARLEAVYKKLNELIARAVANEPSAGGVI